MTENKQTIRFYNNPEQLNMVEVGERRVKAVKASRNDNIRRFIASTTMLAFYHNYMVFDHRKNNFFTIFANLVKVFAKPLLNYAGQLTHAVFGEMLDAADNNEVWAVPRKEALKAYNNGEAWHVDVAKNLLLVIAFFGGKKKAAAYLDAYREIHGDYIYIYVDEDDFNQEVPVGRVACGYYSNVNCDGNLNNYVRLPGHSTRAEGEDMSSANADAEGGSVSSGLSVEQIEQLKQRFVLPHMHKEFEEELRKLFEN